MPLSRRYTPEWAPGERSIIGMDFSSVIPPGVGIVSGNLAILANSADLPIAQSDFTGPPDPNNPTTAFLATVHDRSVYVQMAGGVSGRDYQLYWAVTDTNGNFLRRTALMLCAPTS